MVTNTSCCGIKEWYGIMDIDTEESFKSLMRWYLDSNKKFGIVIFSANDALKKENSFGVKLMNKILDSLIGSVGCSNPVVNPNTGRTIQHFFWEIDHKKATKVAEELLAEENAMRKKKREEFEAYLAEQLPRFKIGDTVRIKDEYKTKILGYHNFGAQIARIKSLDTTIDSMGNPTAIRLKVDGSYGADYYFVPNELHMLEVVDDSPVEAVKKSAKKLFKKV